MALLTNKAEVQGLPFFVYLPSQIFQGLCPPTYASQCKQENVENIGFRLQLRCPLRQY